ncbi:MAG: hypothetical protein AMXMBFR13_23340 [Phycisphaerae bacterium]
MDRWSLDFDAPDLAGWLWVAVGLLAAAELVRYVFTGRRPQATGGRVAIAAFLVLAFLALRITGRLQLDASNHPRAALALGFLLVPWLVRAYARTTRAIRPSVRLGLLVLRVSAAGVVLMLLVRPVLQFLSVQRERPVLGILLDDSRSMTTRDMPGGQQQPETSRLEAVQAALAQHAEKLNALATELDFRWFVFDAQLRELPAPSLKGDGYTTAMNAALERIHERLAQSGAPRGGVVVISDGRDNDSTEQEQATAGTALAAAGVPIYAVGVGSDQPGSQLRLLARRLDCPGSVAVHNRLPVRAEFLAEALAGSTVEVELLFDDEVVDRRRVDVSQPREALSIDLAHTPTTGGLHRVTVRGHSPLIANTGEEASVGQFVRVTDDKIQVLYVDRARHERAIISRCLEAAQEVRVTKLDLSRPAGDDRSSPLPASPLAWATYHVILIGDVDRWAFPDQSLRTLAEMVTQNGRGLALLGGVRTLGSGRFADSPLEQLLPVDLGAAGQQEGPVRLELTPAGRSHPVCQLAADENASRSMWQQLPAFAGSSRLAGVAPTAEVLLRTPEGEALMVVNETGGGRAAALAFDSTWLWSFAHDQGLQAQRRFWRQLVLWLANRKPQVWVAADRPRYDLVRLRGNSQAVVLRAGATDSTTGRVPENMTLTGTLTDPAGRKEELTWIRTMDAQEARPTVNRSGEYRVQVTARSGSRTLGESETAFVVSTPDPEMADTTADLAALKRIAARTAAAGGEYVPLSELGPLLDRISAQRPVEQLVQIRRLHMVDDQPWAWLLVFLALLTTEWVARRLASLA